MPRKEKRKEWRGSDLSDESQVACPPTCLFNRNADRGRGGERERAGLKEKKRESKSGKKNVLLVFSDLFSLFAPSFHDDTERDSI
mmetsp:Transcript_25284/g.49420  ORF Transcript_25284/g.49420 Transcript_25284/m.49420 type:complete len:85 (+) Transcript_25284:867-1121(+)